MSCWENVPRHRDTLTHRETERGALGNNQRIEDTRSSCEGDGHRTVAESYVAVEPPMPRARAICGSHLARGLRSP